MNKKFSAGITISLIAIACAITFVITMSVSLDIYNTKIAGVQQREEIYTKLQEVDSYVRSYSLGEVDKTEVVTGIINGYISNLSDKYAKYYTPQEYYRYTQITSGTLIGLGFDAQADESGYIKITHVYENSSAAEAGIADGDVITVINSANVLETGAAKALATLDGDEGTKAVIKVQRDGIENEYTLERTSFDIVSVSGSVINGIGYVRISAFNMLTEKQFAETVDDLISKEATAFIFDIRSCNGGVYDSVQGMLDKLISEGVGASARYKDESVKTFVQLVSEDSVELPMVILANETTDGPAELFASALKGLRSVELVGTATSGNATIQEIKPFSDGSAVAVTIATIIPVTAETYEDNGLKPEYAAELSGIIETAPTDYELISDNQLLKAFEVVLSKTTVAE